MSGITLRHLVRAADVMATKEKNLSSLNVSSMAMKVVSPRKKVK